MPILINGVTSSIGQALLKICSDNNEIVVGVGRDLNRLNLLRKQFSNLRVLECHDLLDISGVNDFLNMLTDIEITSYVHCVGKLIRYSELSEITLDKWDESIKVNLTSVFIWNQLIIDHFIKRKISGKIVNITSQAFHTGGYSLMPDYVAAKGGIVSLTKSLARVVSKFGIRMNCVSPGFVGNEMMQSGLTLELKDKFIKKIPMGRFGDPSEIAEVCYFLAGDKSSYITGEVIDVSGGQVLG